MTAGDVVKCTRCGHTRIFASVGDRKPGISLDSAVRVAGWRTFNGQTIGGADMALLLCPVCAGTATPEQRQEIAGWDAECETCGATMSEDWDDDAPEDGWTREDARSWQQQHSCEPLVDLIPPKSKAVSA